MRSRTGLALTLWLLTAAACFGQNDVATVLRTVTDASGAVVPQAKLRLDNLQTGVAASAVSDSNGLYQFLDVRIGPYRVTAEAPGFKTVTTEMFALTVAARQPVEVALRVGDAATTVTVNAAAIIETDSSRLQFRAEIFNALNKTNFQAPASNVSNNTFGTITSTLPARQIHLALKFSF